MKGETINVRGKNVIIESQMYTSIEAEPSAIAVLPSEIHMKASDIKIESPLNQAAVVEQSPVEEILQEIEEAKKKALPLFESDGSSIKREGYDNILDSEELFVYFMENFYGKPGAYENYENQPETDIYDRKQPVLTVYEMWLSDVYGKTALEKAADYCATWDGFQMILGGIGFVFPPADLANCIISLGRGHFGDAALDAIGAIPLIGDAIKFGAEFRKGKKVVTGLEYVYKVTEGVDTTKDSVKRIMDALDAAEGVKHGADTVDSAADIKKALKDINELEKLAEDTKALDKGINEIKQLDHVSDGIEAIEKTVNPIRRSTDTIDNVSDVVKTANKTTEGAEAAASGDRVTKYVHKGEEVSSDLKISTEIVDSDGKVLDTMIQGDKELQKIPKNIQESWTLEDWDAFYRLEKDERRIYIEAIENEGEITESVKQIVLKNGGYLEGLEHRIKKPSSVFEKRYLRPDKTLVSEMKDIVRYTEIQDPEKLVQGVKGTLKDFEEEGYKILKVKNTWVDELNPYNGINVQIKAPNGQTFEIQFHTLEGFNLKNGRLHELYEQRRCIKSIKKLKEIDQKMFELSNELVKPIGVETIENLP